MTRPEIDDDLEFVGRQLAFLTRDSSLSLDESLARMSKVADPDISESIDYVRRLRSGEGSGQEHVLSQIFGMIRKAGLNESKVGDLIGEYYRLKKETDQDLANYFLAIKGTFNYGLTVLAVALVVSLLFTIKLVPNFQAVFNELGSDLPAFTAFMMGGGNLFFIGLILFIMAVLGMTGMALYKVYKDFTAFRYSRVPDRLLLSGSSMLGAINDYTLLKAMYLLVRAGAGHDAVCRFTNEMAGRGAVASELPLRDQARSRLQYADRIGTYISELEYQLSHASFRLTDELAGFRATFNVGIQVLTLILIGAMVIGFYLPIFQLGKAV
ncbi:MAG: hypothetical protein R3208_01125 [Ketobacteraceae bacterium]|nr:hypothetical protein [Ketobacteraceae bacterium]